MPNFLEKYKPNFATIERACKNGDLALVHCKEISTGKSVAVVAAVWQDADGHNVVPLARMLEGNPYKEFIGPTASDMVEAEMKHIHGKENN